MVIMGQYIWQKDNYDPHKLEIPIVENSLKNPNLPPIGTKLFVNISQINSIKKKSRFTDRWSRIITVRVNGY